MSFCGPRIWEITLPARNDYWKSRLSSRILNIQTIYPAAASRNAFFLRGDGGSTFFSKTQD